MSSCFPRGTSRCGFEGSGITKPHPAILSSVRSASPSSTTTFTDSTTTSNNSLTISNKKQRTQRKRPNETYKEAAALLSAVYPKLFSSGGSKSAKTAGSKQFFHDESPPELLDRPPGFVGADTELLIYRQAEKIQLDDGGGEDDASDSSGISPVSSKFRCMGIWSSSDEKSSPRSEIQSSSSVNLTDSDLPDSGTEASSFRQQLASPDNACGAGFPKCCQMDEFSETENSGQLSPIHDLILYDDDVINGAGASSAIIGEGFEAESLLENEIDKGLDGILGKKFPDDNSGMDSDEIDNIPINNLPNFISSDVEEPELWALRRDSDRIPAIDMLESFPRLRLVDKIIAQEELSFMAFCSFDWMKKDDNNNCSKSSGGHGLNLKLNHEKVLDEWSDRGPLHSSSSEHGNLVVDGNGLPSSSVSPDSYARLTEFDVFPDLRVWRQLIAAAAATDHEDQQLRLMSGLQLVGCSAAAGVREASVLRYKEKRRTRLFSKKIRYEVRKVNADQRPRMKGRFVRRP